VRAAPLTGVVFRDVADAASIELALAWRADDEDPSVLGVLETLEAAGLFPDTAPTHEATR
jgi:hypothetical protein